MLCDVFLIYSVHLSPCIKPKCLQPISKLVGVIIVSCLQLSSSMHAQSRYASEGQFKLMSQMKLFNNIKKKLSGNYTDGSVWLLESQFFLIEFVK